MSKKLTIDEKLETMRNMYKKFTDEQRKHLEQITNVDARYKCSQRYLRALNNGNKVERQKALKYYNKYRDILEGLECIDEKLWTDEKKIRAFSDLLDAYCDKCVKLVDENNQKHLNRLMIERQKQKEAFEAKQAKFDKEIAELTE